MLHIVALGTSIILSAFSLQPAMTDIKLDQSLASNADAVDEFLIVQFIGSPCAPCEMMRETTWSDGAVLDYLKEHRVTVISVVHEPGKRVTGVRPVWIVPTTVVLRGGKEFDRLIGGLDPLALTRWLDDVRGGRTRIEVVLDAAGERSELEKTIDIFDRIEKAHGLPSEVGAEKAADEFIWLWGTFREHPAWATESRAAYLAELMRRLGDESPLALAKFTDLRDVLTDRLVVGETSLANLQDWLVLNTQVLEDHEAVSAWLDRIWYRPTGLDTVRAVEDLLADWMIEQGEWEKLGVLQPHPVLFFAEQRVLRLLMVLIGLRDEMDFITPDLLDGLYISEVAIFHAACLAAGRETDAWLAADTLLAEVNRQDAIRRLCRAASEASSVRLRHVELAEEIPDKEGEILRATLSEALQPPN